MNTQEKYAAIVTAFVEPGNMNAHDADKVALLLLSFYPKDDSIKKIRESMREIALILNDTADRDCYWDGTHGDPLA